MLGSEGGNFKPLAAALISDSERPTYALSELVDDGPVLEALGSQNGLESLKLKDIMRARGIKPVARMDDGFTLYRLGSFDP